MSATLVALISPIILALASLACAIVSAKRSMPEDSGTLLKGIRDFVTLVSLWVLIPLVVFETTLNAQSKRGSGAVLAGTTGQIVLGAALLVLLVVLGLIVRGVTNGRGVRPATLMSFSSFGGGNRGMFAVLCFAPFLGSASEADAKRFITAFTLIDTGNYIALLVVAPILLTLLTRRPHTPLDFKDAIKHWTSEFGGSWRQLGPPAALLLAVVGALSGFKPSDALADLLTQTSPFRRALLAYFSSLAILVSFWVSRQAIGGSDLGKLVVMVGLRIAILFGTLKVMKEAGRLFGTSFPDLTSVVAHPVGFAVTILLLCPPSNQVPILLRGAKLKEDHIEQSERITVYWTALFVLFVFLMISVLNVTHAVGAEGR